MEYKHQNQEVPAKTAELAQKVFKKGNIYVQMRDDLGIIFENEMFCSLFSHAGRPAEVPGNLALILVMQYMEKLSDRQAAEQVGARIDWKYILGLELEDEGIRYQILSDFRKRIVEGDKVEFLLNTILEQLEEKGWRTGSLNGNGQEHVGLPCWLFNLLDMNKRTASLSFRRCWANITLT